MTKPAAESGHVPEHVGTSIRDNLTGALESLDGLVRGDADLSEEDRASLSDAHQHVLNAISHLNRAAASLLGLVSPATPRE